MFFEDLVNSARGGVYFIAEACDNHMGSFEYAKALVRAAKDSGADAVKFQHHLVAEEMLESCEMSDNFETHLYDFLLENALSLAQHKALKEYCDEQKITYLCTPFSWKAATEISDLVPFFKIGSGEFSDYWFIDKLANLRKPIIFSTGMSSEDELVANHKYFQNLGLDFSMLNCLSEYPPIYTDLNLEYISRLLQLFPETTIGHSDHTDDIASSLVAIAKGARIIEKHLTLSRFVGGPDASVSITPEQFKMLAAMGRKVRSSLGEANKQVRPRERKVRDWAYRSIVSTRHLEAGSIIVSEDICTKRPGTGVPSKMYKEFIGKTVARDIPQNTLMRLEDLI